MLKLTVALNPPKGIAKFIAYAKFIAACMEGNPYFPSPPVLIAKLLAHIADLEAAEIVTRTRVQAAAAARDVKREIVLGDLEQLRMYVQTVANQHAEDAPAVVASSGMSLKRSTAAKKADFTAKQPLRTNSVRLDARHPGGDASFDWQYSKDGVAWFDGPRTVQSRVTLDELVPGTLYWFRYRVLTKAGLGDWSEPITLMVG